MWQLANWPSKYLKRAIEAIVFTKRSNSMKPKETISEVFVSEIVGDPQDFHHLLRFPIDFL